MKKRLILPLFLLSMTLCIEANATGNYQYSAPTNYTNYQGYNNLQGYALYVPAGVTASAVLSQAIDSSTAVTGQSINAVLVDDFMYNGNLIASSGSTIMGTITKARKSGFGGRNAQIQIRFTTIRTPYNNIIPISATIATDDSSGVLKGGTAKDSAKEYAKDTVIVAGSGAVLGTAMGALSGGSVGRGAIYGTALGGGLGLVKAAANKGDSVTIPANSQINIVFDQPITLGAQ